MCCTSCSASSRRSEDTLVLVCLRQYHRLDLFQQSFLTTQGRLKVAFLVFLHHGIFSPFIKGLQVVVSRSLEPSTFLMRSYLQTKNKVRLKHLNLLSLTCLSEIKLIFSAYFSLKAASCTSISCSISFISSRLQSYSYIIFFTSFLTFKIILTNSGLSFEKASVS